MFFLKKINSDPVREAHNSFAPPSSLVREDKKAASDEDAFHFVAYLPFGEREKRERERKRESFFVFFFHASFFTATHVLSC